MLMGAMLTVGSTLYWRLDIGLGSRLHTFGISAQSLRMESNSTIQWWIFEYLILLLQLFKDLDLIRFQFFESCLNSTHLTVFGVVVSTVFSSFLCLRLCLTRVRVSLAVGNDTFVDSVINTPFHGLQLLSRRVFYHCLKIVYSLELNLCHWISFLYFNISLLCANKIK